MSGGVGPTYDDISLPEEKDENPLLQTSIKGSEQEPTIIQRKTSFSRLRQLNSLAIIIVFSASGMVSLEDFIFVFLSFFYIYFLSKFAFPLQNPEKDSIVFDPKGSFFQLYLVFSVTIGLFLPIAYIFHGVLEGDKEGTKAAAPHVFLLASEIFMEGLTFSDKFSAPARMFVPIMYNARRIFAVEEWLMSELYKQEESYNENVSAMRLYIGRVLAVGNMVVWCFNLFGLLLPIALPRAMKNYYTTQSNDNNNSKVD